MNASGRDAKALNVSKAARDHNNNRNPSLPDNTEVDGCHGFWFHAGCKKIRQEVSGPPGVPTLLGHARH